MRRDQYTIVILNRFPEFVRNLIESIRKTHEVMPNIVVVCDNHQEKFGDGISHVTVFAPFVFARNCNAGMAVFGKSDIILCNDDCECVEKDFFHKLAESGNPNWGVLSPLIDGGVGNPYQNAGSPEIAKFRQLRPLSRYLMMDSTICFPCVYLSREMIDAIGPLDESFIDYGFDDDDYCIRARENGFKTGIDLSLKIKHGCGGWRLARGKNWSCSFAQVLSRKSNLEVFSKKYPLIKF